MLPTKPTLTHYEFIKQIALAWINKDLYWPKDNVATISKKEKQRMMRRERLEQQKKA